jgi:DNA-binding transcriptional LysR family regulator
MNLNPATYNWTLLELRAFCLVCDQKNLSSTAQRLGITQQTLSMMVRRWREALRDPIYTRSRYGVLPTEFSIALRSQLERPLQEVQQALNEPRQFDPSTSSRTFKLHMSDIGQLVFLPSLSAAIEQTAPHVRLDVRQIPWDDVPHALATGAVDLAIGSLPMVKGRIHLKKLRRESYVTVMRKGHRLTEKSLDLAAYMDATHLGIDAPSSGHRLIEALLQARGICRHIGLTISHYLAAERILLNSNHLLTVPEVAVRAFHDPSAFCIQPVPAELSSFDINLHWHERAAADQAVQWLKNEVVRASAKLEPRE